MAASKPSSDAVRRGVVGIVLAAGAGRRMGGPKALIGPLASPDRTPLARVCAWVHEAGCERVIAVIGAESDAVRAAVAPQPWLTLAEASDWDSGMGASLRTGLSAAHRSDATAALITLVDLPDVRSPIFASVLAAGENGPTTLRRASYAGRPGHPVLIGRDHWAAVAASAVGDRGARDYFARTPHLLIECGHLGTGEDADAPAPGVCL